MMRPILFVALGVFLAGSDFAMAQAKLPDVLSQPEREVLAPLCFKKAHVDVSSIRGTKCEWTTSNSGVTAYYRCAEHETAVNDCACPPAWPGQTPRPCDPAALKPALAYMKKPRPKPETPAQQIAGIMRRDFERCYSKVDPKPAESTETLLRDCTMRQSNSGNTIYGDCKHYGIELSSCMRGEKAYFSKFAKPADSSGGGTSSGNGDKLE